jgi:hypothetical protein
MTNNERHLDELFLRYRSACPDVEASAEFMPKLWARIENKRNFSSVFQHLGRVLVKASAAACLLLAGLNLLPPAATSAIHAKYATYADALSAEMTLERTYVSDTAPAYNLPADYQL